MFKQIFVFIGFTLASVAFSQDISVINNNSEAYNIVLEKGSARYSAMAGSMGALGGDISSINVNPAGIGLFIVGDMRISLSMDSSTNQSKFSESSIEKSLTKSWGQIGAVMVLSNNYRTSSWKFINMGIDYTSTSLKDIVQTAGSPYIKEPFYEGTEQDYDVYSGHEYYRTGNHSRISFAIGANYENKLYLGGGANFTSVKLTQSDELLISSENNPSKSGIYKKQNTPYEEDSRGFSLSIGVIGRINENFRLSGAIETPTWYGIDRSYVFYDRRGMDLYNEDRTMSTPAKFSLSGAYVAKKNFAFNVDYRRELGKPRFFGADAEYQLNSFYDSMYKSRNELRLGAEYRYQRFKLRGGYALVNSPYRSYNYSERSVIENGQQYSEGGFYNYDGTISSSGTLKNYIVGDMQIISGGLGYNFNTFYIDFAYQYITSMYSNPFFAGIYVYPNGDGRYDGTSIFSSVNRRKGSMILTLGCNL